MKLNKDSLYQSILIKQNGKAEAKRMLERTQYTAYNLGRETERRVNRYYRKFVNQ